VKLCAEIGVNHNGSFDLARKLIDLSVANQFHAVKFQTFIPEKLCSDSSPKAQYHIETTGTDDEGSWLDLLRSQQLSFDEFRELKQYCDTLGIEFISTPYCCETLQFLIDLGVKTIKIASADIVNIPLLNLAASSGCETIISTGMSSLEEISRAITCFPDISKLILLDCISSYPLPSNEANLFSIQHLAKTFSCRVGYSDHTSSVLTASLCYSLRCYFYEKHITLDKTMHGPDHRSSIDPCEIAQMIDLLDQATELCGIHNRERPSPAEISNIQFMRKGVYLAKPLGIGEVLTLDHLSFCRPQSDISIELALSFVGLPSSRNYLPGQSLASTF